MALDEAIGYSETSELQPSTETRGSRFASQLLRAVTLIFYGFAVMEK
jgi:hypothetical protein